MIGGLRICCGLDGPPVIVLAPVLHRQEHCSNRQQPCVRTMLPSASRDMQVLQAHPCLRQRTAALSSLHGFFVASRVQIDRVLVVAMLIFFITDDFDVALHFLLTRSLKIPTSAASTFEDAVREVWPLLLDDNVFASMCALELCFGEGVLRLQADQFIMETILVGRILDATRRGLVLTLQAVIDEYMSLWMKRSVPASIVPMLLRLTHHYNTRRKFGVRLRRIWNLHLGCLRTITCHDESDARIKVVPDERT